MTAMPQDIERELIQAVRRLPAARVAEVLDFAQFLMARDPAPAGNGDEQAISEWEDQIQRISLEQRAYEYQHQAILKRYRGRYIAMRQGQIVDDDTDKTALSRRIRQQYGNESVLIKLVQSEPMETYHIRSPKLAKEQT
ncbi:MAG: DUF5678 domain-containing protein [Anaerolineae bacterium]|jgi:hypothetical protein